MNTTSIVIPAFLVSAGVMLCSGFQALAMHFLARQRPLRGFYALMCFCAAGFQLATAAYYVAETVPSAVLALHWQTASICGLSIAFFGFVALYTRQRSVGPWLMLVATVATALMVGDLLSPYGIRFQSIALALPLQLPWGEVLGHVAGTSNRLNRAVLFGPTLAISLWALQRARAQYETGERRMAIFLGLCVTLLIASGIWGSLIDAGVVRSFYVGGFGFISLVWLMSVARNQVQVRTLDELRAERDRLQDARLRLESSEYRLRLVLKGTNDGWWDWNIVTGEHSYSARGWEALGYECEELSYDDRLWDLLVHPDDRAYGQRALMEAIENGSENYSFEMRMRHRDGHPVPVLCRGYILRDSSGKAIRVSGTDTDLTERKQAEADTHRLAYYDELTRLPNRRLLLDRIGLSLESARRSGQFGALLFLDLDNFKRLNDARGHSIGDSLLMEVAQRLTQLFRSADLVARLGGDEFVVLVDNLGTDLEPAARAAMAVAEKVRAVLERPFLIDGTLYSGTGSVGLTMFPKNREGVDDLLREADTAMYRAKATGRNRIAYYESAMQAEVEERLALEQDLKEAVDTGQISIFVQPQVNAAGTEIGGELLLRWTHPERGAVSPTFFIPIAEESGLILRLGALVLRTACEALARMNAAGSLLSLSVNISPRQFRQDDFVEQTRAMLAAAGAPPSRLILEVTEGLLIEDWEDVASRMTELAAMGIRFSIDDFGTGYSSLSYLKKLPLHEIKIDKSFVQNTPDDANDRAIVRSILAVARAFRLHVVAEGVETQAQADFLAQLQCDCLQGFFFARPMPLESWLPQRVVAVVG